MPRTARWLRLAMMVTLLLTMLAAPSAPPLLAQGQPADGWVSLGPSLPLEMYGLAVSSAWPNDPFIIARVRPPSGNERNRNQASEPAAVRTFDGGKTWEPLSEAPPTDRLLVVHTRQSGRLIFALPALGGYMADSRARPSHMHRSTDDGITWRTALTNLGGSPSQFVPSPNFVDDGYAYLLDGGTLFETSDFGETWTQRTPVQDQLVQALVFSPAFATDRTVYSAIVSASFRAYGDGRQATAPVDSVGVMVSQDAGLTWTPASGGIEIDGAPYRHVQSLAISPAFEQDRTLFAFARGPREMFAGGSPKWNHAALFRSQDNGKSWQLSWQPAYRPANLPGGYVVDFSLTMHPFPTFGDDGRIATAFWSQGGSPSSGGCVLQGSEDRGRSWRTFQSPSSFSCVHVVPRSEGAPSVLVGGRSNGTSPLTYVMSDQIPTQVHPPVSLAFDWDTASKEGPVVSADGSIFFGTNQGVWMLPPNAPNPVATP